MDEREKPLELLIMCAVIVLLSILGIVAGFSRDLFGTLDGLLILALCLMMALIFGILLLVLAKQQGWLGGHHGDASAPAKGK